MTEATTEAVSVRCYQCGEEHSSEYLTHDGQEYCTSCFRLCSRCDTFVGDDGWWVTDLEELYCESCSDYRTFYCDRCENRYSFGVDSYSSYDSHDRYCASCAEEAWYYCGSCDNHYVSECECDPEEEQPRIINSYSYKPMPMFFDTSNPSPNPTPGKLYFGIELECEIWSRDIEGASLQAEGTSDFFYLKEDSSIGSGSPSCYHGFEIVSHPYSFEYWQKPGIPFLRYVELIRSSYKARSWDAESSCGLHIHLSRAGFGGVAHIHRFLSLVYSNSVELSKLGGRKGSSYAKFSDVYKFDDYGKPRLDFQDKLHRSGYSERYSAVNTINENTLELRWFRGTLKVDSILAHIQLAHSMVEHTRYLTVAQVREGALRWDRFVSYVTEHRANYPELMAKIAKLETVNLNVHELQEA